METITQSIILNGQTLQIEGNIEQPLFDAQDTINKIKYHQLIINGLEVKMYGDAENPLFKCSDILIKLLGYAKSGLNWFYKVNKTNLRYIVREVNPLPKKTTDQASNNRVSNPHPKKTTDQASNNRVLNPHPNQNTDYISNNRVLNSDPNQTSKTGDNYFTELGLYRCLFSSKKEVAIDFQEQVAQLLKDIRLGNIKLQIVKECELTNIVSEQRNEILQYITKTSDILQQLQQFKDQVDSLEDEIQVKNKIIDKTAQPIVIYDKQLQNGKHYIGSTNNIYQRNRQHSRKSSNKHLRDAYQSKQIVRTRSLINIKCYSKDDIKFVERLCINQVPKQQLLNIALPNPNMENVTFDDTQQEEIKQQLGCLKLEARLINQVNSSGTSIICDENDDSDDDIEQIDEVLTIDEQSMMDTQSIVDDSKWFIRFKEVESYANRYKKLPSNKSINKEIKSLAWFCTVQRCDKANNRGVMNQYRSNLLETISIWYWTKEDSWLPIFEQFKKFKETNKKYPIEKSKDKQEQKLFRWVATQRQAFKGQGNRLMTPQREQLLNSIDFIWDTTYYWDSYYQRVLQFITLHKRLPIVYDSDKDEQSNARWLCSQKQLKKENQLSDSKIQKLNELPGFKFVVNHDWDDVYFNLTNFIKANKRLPKISSKNGDEKYIAQWQKIKKHCIESKNQMMINNVNYYYFLDLSGQSRNLNELIYIIFFVCQIYLYIKKIVIYQNDVLCSQNDQFTIKVHKRGFKVIMHNMYVFKHFLKRQNLYIYIYLQQSLII